MGKSGSASAAGKAASHAQAAQAKELFELNKPARSGLNQQLLEVLQTGGSQARLPITQNIVESSARASSNALTQNQTDLSKYGLAQTPLGVGSQAGLRGVAARDLTNAGTQVPRALAAGAPAIIQQQAAIGAQQGSAAAAGQAQRAGVESQQNAATTATATAAAGAAVGIGIAIII